MVKKERLKSILLRTKKIGNINEEILEDLSNEERELVIELNKEGLIDEAIQLIENMDTEKEWDLFKSRISVEPTKVIPLWKTVLKYAALLVGIGLIAYFSLNRFEPEIDATQTSGTIKLKTGNDAVKILKENISQKLVSSSGEVLGEQKGNKISYKSTSEIDELVYSELEIPYGKIFDLEFSDGTIVHLNSGTKIRYPVKFLKGLDREVFIEGEAYFKVSKDKNHPFIVHADEVDVKVLGTEFNITSYKEDNDIKTVLVEGSVSMSNSNKNNVVLNPGEKGTWSRGASSTSVEQVDVGLYTSWIKGELLFRNESFKNMAKKLERKYMVQIQNNNLLLSDKKFNARFNVNIESIEDVIKSISEIQKFEYQITSDKVIIQ
ncbi:FecR domain-containing protein [Maribacter sp. PR1]|uniref:FecR domain-containing protein n=1 Tax=Maribacter cobaltidurans TaxID=1178778 RepID=A0ABU7IUG5_9FLAO|nr:MULTISPECIES: FecR family protein [Maribacter]MDC6389207.1 FecR domain-containing protein [Maribacter sp. PR1]MEE1976594.1 FecR domain-containing protein [Maribacter cobaltidurans]